MELFWRCLDYAIRGFADQERYRGIFVKSPNMNFVRKAYNSNFNWKCFPFENCET